MGHTLSPRPGRSQPSPEATYESLREGYSGWRHHGLSDLLRQAMARTRTWPPAAADIQRERSRQVARIGNNLNQLARWANTHTSAAKAVTVIANLVAFERSLRAVARFGGEDGDAH